MRKIETPKTNVRQDLITKGFIKANGAQTDEVPCTRCGETFERLSARAWDNTCGGCMFPRREQSNG